MARYIAYRLGLIIPTLLGIMLINFLLVQFAPGGPVERIIAQVQGTDVSATARLGIIPDHFRAAAAMAARAGQAGCRISMLIPPANIAARRGLIPNSSPSWSNNSVSTNPPMSGFSR